MTYLSVCSGIEAATVAWEPLGWKPVGFSEIEPFPCSLLSNRYPEVRNYGDMTKYREWNLETKPDVLVGGTPCQSYSISGLRKGLDDPRGDLMLTFGAISRHFKPQWVVWENVTGVLSSNKGRDFGTFLGMLGELGYGFSYRVFDSQYFGVPQRRRRVFVIGYLGDWRPSAQVLFESEDFRQTDPPLHKNGENPSQTLQKNLTGSLDTYDQWFSIGRRYTPIECERLQGFPDNYTNTLYKNKPASDLKRYNALGNSMSVPVMRHIGQRIQKVEDSLRK
jgi:DNA (cytosine-5)-methyltransferase 1